MPRHRKPTALQNSARVIRKAARVIRDRGWTQGTLEDGSGRVCSVGAINVAAMGNPQGDSLKCVAPVDLIMLPNAARKLNPQAALAARARFDLSVWLQENRFSRHGHQEDVIHWNDDEGRTADEVVQYMEKFADEVDPRR